MRKVFSFVDSSFRQTSRKAYRRLTTAAEAVVFAMALTTAFLLRFEFSVPAAIFPAMLWSMAVWLPVKLVCAHLFGLHRGSWRYFSTPDVRQLALANAAASVVAGAATLIVCPYIFPRSIILLDLLLAMLFAAGARAFICAVCESMGTSPRRERRRTLVYGAGAAAVMLLREARTNASFPNLICGLIDDDPSRSGLTILGTPVLGCGADLCELVEQHRIDEVLIAVPSAGGPAMSRIIDRCQKAGVPFRTIPALSEIMSNRGLSRQIRDVAVDDVLGRSAIQLDKREIANKLKNRIALVTGAAGSIGSELCRQIAAAEPAALVAFDTAETPLFHLDRDLREAFPNLKLHTEIGSVQNVQRLEELFRTYRPRVVYHAAAYKHVPMMEANIFEAIENNVFGTYNLGLIASEHDVEDFVMISSDKAVRPTNVMGASKRAAELVIRSLQGSGTRFVSVRFGNVLGSNGSVVPLFKKQIAEGGPVTVTHPEMTRYFMTIPEAVQLVLQASTMGKGGEIFVLDMGTPVKIVELARQLIVLSGFKPDEDIRIEFSGIRPGEKLYEELRLFDEEVLPTTHEKIKVFAGYCPPEQSMIRQLNRLRAACERRDVKALLFELKEIEPDYNPSKDVLSRAFEADLARLSEAVNLHSELTADVPATYAQAAGD